MKKYSGAVCYSNKIFGELINTLMETTKFRAYTANGYVISLSKILSGALKSVTVDNDKVVGFKVATDNLVAEMAIVNNKLYANKFSVISGVA